MAQVGDKYQQGIYDARKLARKQNIVVVSLNYRQDLHEAAL